ncbi:endonuclease domain-containing 1 protein-like [Oncorhynchus masou masou]|uniref:endonuclease domain-containing 1 protein-like n=1 Tax=Oncorhynchus masou masou TaxID=90313 RepID=UPI003183E8F4
MMGVLNHLSTLLLLSLLPPALSHVVENFSVVPQCKTFFLEGTTPNLPGILVGGTVQNQSRYKPICQKYNNMYRFATLYDTTNKIPVFSAYTFTGKVVGRPKSPGLESIDVEEMKTQHGAKLINNSRDIRVIHQAVDADYNATVTNMILERGHLFPCSHTPDDDTMASTFTLTNVVPQERGFNRGRWCRVEQNVKKTLLEKCKDNKTKAYVVTGAVPSNNNTLNNRVNIPALLWTAFCCYNNNTSNWTVGAYWGRTKTTLGKH